MIVSSFGYSTLGKESGSGTHIVPRGGTTFRGKTLAVEDMINGNGKLDACEADDERLAPVLQGGIELRVSWETPGIAAGMQVAITDLRPRIG